MPRLAVLSDLHIEHETVRWARCGSCGGLLVSRRAGEGDRCACGKSAIKAGKGGRRVTGTAEWLPPEPKGWGDRCREEGAGLVLLAGDVHSGAQGVAWAEREFGGLPVAYVAGNHEFYGWPMEDVLAALALTSAESPSVRFLERGTAVYELDGRRVRVYGCTLWTDYEANVPPDANPMRRQGAVGNAVWHAEQSLNDHHMIGVTRDGAKRLFTPGDALALHRLSVEWLDAELAAADPDEIAVVVTHHGPSTESESPEYRGGALSPAFVSDLTPLIRRRQPALWLHGHTHHGVDYAVGRTRVVSRQRGYPHEPQAKDFAPLVVEVG